MVGRNLYPLEGGGRTAVVKLEGRKADIFVQTRTESLEWEFPGRDGNVMKQVSIVSLKKANK